ncbi:uncharacterized protein LOC127749236 [Frankliniella occidentalis]|uniref:Uncharacterized protein LOC127749236 n=1 Tax=Frankliniella occidentalis TaxID=133901 RepID=A0A9C6TUG5_FRAOC|nr:uncharacterized protein LOC127749236 [Frankliniella occidentalis]
MATAPQHRQRWIALLQVWLVVLLYPGARAGLRLLHVSVPPVLLRGETASLQCEYELGGDRLYSVQWYKDDDEIYRFVPRAGMQKHSYLVDGVHVDVSINGKRRANTTDVAFLGLDISWPPMLSWKLHALKAMPDFLREKALN